MMEKRTLQFEIFAEKHEKRTALYREFFKVYVFIITYRERHFKKLFPVRAVVVADAPT